jgi:hypothetical protein
VWFYIRKSLVNTVTKGMLPSCYQRKKVAVGNTTTLKNEMEAKEEWQSLNHVHFAVENRP